MVALRSEHTAWSLIPSEGNEQEPEPSERLVHRKSYVAEFETFSTPKRGVSQAESCNWHITKHRSKRGEGTKCEGLEPAQHRGSWPKAHEEEFL